MDAQRRTDELKLPHLIVGKNADFTDGKADLDRFKKDVIDPYVEGSFRIIAEEMVEEWDEFGIEITVEFAYKFLKRMSDQMTEYWRKEYNNAK